jgi:hypothetical protein
MKVIEILNNLFARNEKIRVFEMFLNCIKCK